MPTHMRTKQHKVLDALWFIAEKRTPTHILMGLHFAAYFNQFDGYDEDALKLCFKSIDKWIYTNLYMKICVN